MKLLLFCLSLASYSFSATLTDSYKLHHRIYHVSIGHLPYAERGTIHFADDGSSSFLPADTLAGDLTLFEQSIDDLNGPIDTLYYQLALQRGEEPQSSWDFTSVKACHLPQVNSQTIVLHTQDGKPFAIDYYISPIPPDGSCPKPLGSKSSAPALAPFTAFASNIRGLNTTILLKSQQPLLLPELRKPQPIAPTGQPIEPVPEKSFIQKYWMYLAVAFIALLLTGGEEEGPRKQARA